MISLNRRNSFKGDFALPLICDSISSNLNFHNQNNSTQFSSFMYCDHVTRKQYKISSLKKKKIIVNKQNIIKKKDEEAMICLLEKLLIMFQIKKKRNTFLIQPLTNRILPFINNSNSGNIQTKSHSLKFQVRKAIMNISRKYLSKYLQNQLNYQPKFSKLQRFYDFSVFTSQQIKQLFNLIAQQSNQNKNKANQKTQISQIKLENEQQINDFCQNIEKQISFKIRRQGESLIPRTHRNLFK